jgi:hypothetical protein
MAAQNNRGGGGGAAPTVRVVEGWSSCNDGFNFWHNPPDGCGVLSSIVADSAMAMARKFHGDHRRRSSIDRSCKLKTGTSKNCKGNPNLFLRM